MSKISETRKLNEECYKLLGLCYHKLFPYVLDNNECTECIHCHEIFPWVKFYNANTDFTTSEGKIELLKIMEKREDYRDFIITTFGSFDCSHFTLASMLTDDTGKFINAVISFLKTKK